MRPLGLNTCAAYDRAMVNNWVRQVRSALWPAAIVIPLLLALWLWARWGYAGAANRSLEIDAFVGWIAFMFLAATLAGVLCAASAREAKSPDPEPIAPSRQCPAQARLLLGYAMMVTGCGLLLLWIGVGGDFITAGDVARIVAILAAWTGMWMQITCVFRRVTGGRGPFAAVGGLSLAMLFFAAPVTLLPAARALTGHSQEMAVTTIGWATPLLGTLGAMKQSILVGWATKPQMYQLSALGQDIPMALPAWWHGTMLYAGIATLAWASQFLAARRSSRRVNSHTPIRAQ
jgi:hypothetical protein